MNKDKLAKILDKPIKAYNDRAIKSFYKSQKVEAKKIDPKKFDHKRILLLMPHVDDETISAGGLLLSLKERPKRIDLLYTTACIYKEGPEDRRIKEAEKISRALSLNYLGNLPFLDSKEKSNLENNPDLVKEIISVLTKTRYDLIIIPSILDGHPDHFYTAKALSLALKSLDYSPFILMTETSNLLPIKLINLYYPLTKAHFREKEALYKSFPSQRKIDFSIYSRLAKNRPLSLKSSPYGAEFYSLLSKEEFIGLAEKFNWEKTSSLLPHRIGSESSFYKVIRKEKKRQEAYEDIL